MRKVNKVWLAAVLGGTLAVTSAAAAFAGETEASTESSTEATADFTGSGKVAYVCTGLGDMSFNDSGEVGMNVLRAAGYDVNTIETGEDASTYDQLIQNALEDGCDYMVVSSTYQDNVEAIADQYPDTKFILFDINSDSEVAADNMLYIYFSHSYTIILYLNVRLSFRSVKSNRKNYLISFCCILCSIIYKYTHSLLYHRCISI